AERLRRLARCRTLCRPRDRATTARRSSNAPRRHPARRDRRGRLPPGTDGPWPRRCRCFRRRPGHPCRSGRASCPCRWAPGAHRYHAGHARDGGRRGTAQQGRPLVPWERRVKLLPKPRPEVAVHGLFVVFGFVIAAFFPFFTIYLQGRGLSADQIGVVIAATALARIIGNPIWGHYADTRMGRLTAFQIGTVGAGVFAAAMNLVDGLAAITIVAAIIAAFWGATGPNIDSIALVHRGDEAMADYGRLRGWMSASYALGCLVFGAILEVAGVEWAMPIYAL